MGQIMKKVLCSLLAVLMITSAVPVNAIALELESVGESIAVLEVEENVSVSEREGNTDTQVMEGSFNRLDTDEHEAMATTPKTVTIAQAEERLNTLINKLNGKAFTKSGDFCTSAHEEYDDAESVVAASWFKNLIGMGTISTSNFPATYWYDGEKGSYTGSQCWGFACFAHWYIFAQKNTDNVVSEFVAKGPLTYNTLKKALPGDVIQTNRWGSPYGHTMIFVSCDSSGFTVLDCNGIYDKKTKWCEIKTDKYSYSSSYQVAITGVTNYDRNSSTVSVTGISLDYSDINIKKNYPFTLTATVYPSSATNKTVKWSSVDPSVATVSSNGEVTGVSAGRTVITATTADGNYSASCDVEVIGDTYTITYDLNGGTWSRSNTQIKYEKQEIYLAKEIPAKEGFVFGGWEEIGECYKLSPEKPESGDYTTYYKYYIWGYEHDSDYTFLYGKDKDELISHIKNNSKTFGSYNPAKMRYFYLLETADKGSSFYPGKSGSNYNYFNAEYISEDGYAGTARIYKTEFYFEQRMYEYLVPNRSVHQPGDMYVVDDDLYLTAIWEYPESFMVYFDPNGGYGGIEYMLVEGTQFTVPDTEDCIPSRVNYLFLYWFDDEGAYEPGNTYTINEDKHLLAAWAPDWEPEITVGNITGKPGEVVSVPVDIMNNFYPAYARIEFDVICDGLTFFNFEQVGTPLHGLLGYLHIQIPDDAVAGQTYSVQLDLKEFVVDETYDITAIVKITNGTITIEEPEKEYTVTFDPGKGTGGPEDITVTGNEFTVPTEIPVRENWNFLFWMGQNGKGYHPGKTYPITENLDLVAIFEPGWMPEISVENVKGKPGEKVELRVTIANNKENPENYSIITGIKPYRDEREDHVFDYTVVTLPQNGMIGKITFTIPEDAEPGIIYEATIRSDKWIVSGFDMASSEMLKFNNGTITVEEPEKVTYTVTYDANGGTGVPAAQIKTEGEALKLSTTKPVRDGYEFLGWATSKTATTAQYQPGDSYTKDESVTLYAVWKQKEVIPEDAPTIVIGEVSGRPGEIVEVPVVLKNNPGFAGADLLIKYDKDVLELIEIKLGLFPANNMASITSGKISGGDSKNITEDGVMFTAVLKIKETAKEGDSEISLTFYECYNIKDEDVTFNISKGKVNVCSYIPGDANSDGKVSSRDITRILQYLVDELGDKTIDIEAADFNDDGKVSSRDITAILKYLVE